MLVKIEQIDILFSRPPRCRAAPARSVQTTRGPPPRAPPHVAAPRPRAFGERKACPHGQQTEWELAAEYGTKVTQVLGGRTSACVRVVGGSTCRGAVSLSAATWQFTVQFTARPPSRAPAERERGQLVAGPGTHRLFCRRATAANVRTLFAMTGSSLTRVQLYDATLTLKDRLPFAIASSTYKRLRWPQWRRRRRWRPARTSPHCSPRGAALRRRRTSSARVSPKSRGSSAQEVRTRRRAGRRGTEGRRRHRRRRGRRAQRRRQSPSGSCLRCLRPRATTLVASCTPTRRPPTSEATRLRRWASCAPRCAPPRPSRRCSSGCP